MAFCQVTGTALVLGSAQSLETIDTDEAERSRIEITRRPAGGGAVFVAPDAQVWADAWIPRGDPLWDDDLVRSAYWLGEVWSSALTSLGVRGVEVRRGRSLDNSLSRSVCFAGLGPGEVTVNGAKVVGLSQRRTRRGARFLTVAHASFDASTIADLLSLDSTEKLVATLKLNEAAAGLDDVVPDRADSQRGRSLIAAVERAVTRALPR